MIGNLKVLGLALVAVFAVSAMAASSASATTHTFTSTTTWTVLHGEQTGTGHEFTIGGQAVKCTTTTFAGSQPGTSATEVTITPTYTNCKYGPEPATVNMTGCDYLITGETNATGHNIVHIKCPAGVKIMINATVGSSPCELTIAEQTARKGLVFTNNTHGTTKDLDLDLTTEITVGATGSAIACKALNNAVAAYTGSTTLTGKDTSNNPVDITVDGAADTA